MIVRSAPLVGCVSQQEMVCTAVRSKGPPQSANDDVEEVMLDFDIGIAFLYVNQTGSRCLDWVTENSFCVRTEANR